MAITAQTALHWSEQGYVPEKIIRRGIKRLLAERLIEVDHSDNEQKAEAQHQFIKDMCEAPIALLPEKANQQHYEIPAEFVHTVLGKHKKYSCCYWPEGVESLDEAEQRSLLETCKHAQLNDGQKILELGCGSGSLALWMAEHYPNSQIDAVSNSHSQREYIESVAASCGLTIIKVHTCDMNDFNTAERYDRVVSVEMFEHMRNCVIHVSSDAPPVDIKLDNAVAVPALDYPQSTGFVSITAGTYDVAVDAIAPGGNLDVTTVNVITFA